MNQKRLGWFDRLLIKWAVAQYYAKEGCVSYNNRPLILAEGIDAINQFFEAHETEPPHTSQSDAGEVRT